MFEFKCESCGAGFEELFAREQDASRAVCPKCGSRQVNRQLSVFAAHAATPRPAAKPSACDHCCGSGGMCPMSGGMP